MFDITPDPSLYWPFTRSGFAVAGGVDLNRDSTPDVLISAPRGKGGTVLAYSGADGSVIAEFRGQEDTRIGHSVDIVGDVDGDSNPEIIIGAPGTSTAQPKVGAAFVYSMTHMAVNNSSPVAGAVNSFQISSAAPSQQVHLARSRFLGWADSPSCIGLGLRLREPALMGAATTNIFGQASIAGIVPGSYAGRTAYFQAFQPGSGMVSDLLKLDF